MTGSQTPTPTTLRALSDGEFAEFAASFVAATRPEWSAERSPPSPDASVDVSLRRGDRRRLLELRQDPADARLGAPAVRELTALCDDRGFDAVTLATTAGFADAARDAARDDRVRLVDGEALARRAAEAGVTVPASRPSDPDREFDRLLHDLTAYWPEALAERARETVRAVDARAAFERRVHRGDASAELRFRTDGATLVRARFSETSFLLFVEGEGGAGAEPVVRLSAFRERQPPLSEFEPEVTAAIDRALRRSERDET